MTTKITKKGNLPSPPPYGWITELAALCKCSRHTVRTAIYDNAKGLKADKVRKMFDVKYGEVIQE